MVYGIKAKWQSFIGKKAYILLLQYYWNMSAKFIWRIIYSVSFFFLIKIENNSSVCESEKKHIHDILKTLIEIAIKLDSRPHRK